MLNSSQTLIKLLLKTLIKNKKFKKNWGRLSSNAKKTDIKCSVLQDMLLRISSAVMLTVASLLESRETKTFQIIRGLCHG